jgi:hypothetical protein
MPLKDHVDYDPSEHESRLLCGDPQACAWEWIRGYARNLSDSAYDDDEPGWGSVTADELIETGMTHVESESRWGGDFISKGGLLEGRSTDPIFWDKLAALKGLEIPHDKRNNFFSCSC